MSMKKRLERFWRGRTSEEALILAFIAVFALFIVTGEIVFAVMVPILIILLALPHDFTVKHLKYDIREIVISFLLALAIWFALSFVLNTAAPLDTVTSCSMLPALERGDLVVLYGGEPSAPMVNVSSTNEIMIQKQPCNATIGNETKEIACTTGIWVHNQLITANLSNDVIVYVPAPGDKFAETGIIIHRVFARVNVSGKVYYFTKGDNNAAMDQEVGNAPVSEDRVHGKVILRIPYLGFFKLLLFGQFSPPPGCDVKVWPSPQA